MFCKLALGNVRRSFRDYGVYLLTLTFGVCLFYTFNSVEDQGAILYLQEKNGETVRAILTVLGVLSVFVAVVLACLILYAHRFLLRRRKKELGCYLLLGMSPGQVSRLLILETAVTGLISLAAGLILGSAASSGLSALTLSLFQMDVSAQLGLVFSPGAAVKTAVCFGAILLLVMALSGVEVTRARLIDLLRGDRKNEVLPLRPLSASVVQFVAGVACLLAAYGILLYFGLVTALVVLPLCAAMLILGTAGTLLLFRSLPGFVLHGVKRHPALYYRGLNLFTLRQWLSRVHSTYLSQTVIAILLLLAMGITASSVGLNSTIQALTDDQAPFDLTVQNRSADESGPVDFDAAIKAGGAESALAWSRPAGPSPSATTTPCWSTWAAPPTPAPCPISWSGRRTSPPPAAWGCSASWWRTRSPSGWRSAASCGRRTTPGTSRHPRTPSSPWSATPCRAWTARTSG